MMKQLLTTTLIFTILVSFGTTTKVTRIIDGDTFDTENGERVRLIGINTPEVSDIFGQEAKQHLANLIEQKTIDLQPDNISSDRDRYSRLLRYVYCNGKDINKQMILDGFATAYLKYHFSKSEEYRQAQLMAIKENFGMWGSAKMDEIIQQQNKKEDATRYPSPKTYFIGGVIFLLICLGIYYFFKK